MNLYVNIKFRISTNHFQRKNNTAFSLIELVIVIVLIGIVSAIAIPRFSAASEKAAANSLKQNLQIVGKALELYAAEHNGEYPTIAKIGAQLTTYSDAQGDTSNTKTTQYYLGPYLRDAPTLTVGKRKGQKGISNTDGPTIGWIYQKSKGRVLPNFLPERTEEQTEDLADDLLEKPVEDIIEKLRF